MFRIHDCLRHYGHSLLFFFVWLLLLIQQWDTIHGLDTEGGGGGGIRTIRDTKVVIENNGYSSSNHLLALSSSGTNKHLHETRSNHHNNIIARHLTLGNTSNCWLQLGPSIVGSPRDALGASVDLSSSISDSSKNITLAIGAYGYATVYDYQFPATHTNNIRANLGFTDGEWIQRGNILHGDTDQPDDEFGKAVSISSDGTIIAVGAPFHNDGNSTDRRHTGHVRVYRYHTHIHTWTTMGQTLTGHHRSERFGHSLALSHDGGTLVVGTAYAYDDTPARTYVYVYNHTDDRWTTLGGTMDGRTPLDESGSVVAISGEGSVVALGAPSGGDDRNGMVRLFRRPNGSTNTYTATTTSDILGNNHNRNHNHDWTQIGNDIIGEFQYDRAGSSLSLSYNGTVVAIGAEHNDGTNGPASGHVRVYTYQSTTDAWIQRGSDIDGESSSDFFGSSVSLSDDGTVVAVGAWGNDGNGPTSGHARVYRYDDDEEDGEDGENGKAKKDWVPYGQDLDGDNEGDASGDALALSADGMLLVVGSRSGGDSGGSGNNGGLRRGQVRVFYNTGTECDISLKPSGRPTALPSEVPSGLPSVKPTDGPSGRPTDQPSAVPSVAPSAVPSVVFSVVPTSSHKPSVVPGERTLNRGVTVGFVLVRFVSVGTTMVLLFWL